jgi:hypothetical protein
MSVSGQDLVQLIENARRYPQGSPKRQRALHKLLLVVQKLPDLRRDNHPNYPDALSFTWEWFIKKIDEFEYDPNFPELVEKSLTNWINGTLKYRILDLKTSVQKEKKLKTSLDKPIGNDEDNRTKGDTISNEDALIPTLDGLEGYIQKEQQKKIQRIGLNVESYIENDPDNKLQQCHPKEKPKCNAQVLAQRMFLKEPPDKLKPISREMDIQYQTLVSFWKRKGLPLLREIVTELGYQPPKVS